MIKLSGQNLEDAQSVEFSGKGIRGEIVSALGNAFSCASASIRQQSRGCMTFVF